MKKKNMLIILLIFSVIALTVGISLAFFNYTKKGSAHVLDVGNVYFTSEEDNSINLTNAYPIDSNDINLDTDNVGSFEITITGNSDYDDGIEYLVSSTNTNLYTTTGKIVPISLDISVSNLGTEDNNYFTVRDMKNANIYKRLLGDTLVGDEMLLVGFIKPNTTIGTSEGVNGKITIKAYIDKDNVIVSNVDDDWDDGKTILTLSEWNSIHTNNISFQVNVEANSGIWVNGSLEDMMKSKSVMDNINSTYVNNTTPGINFSRISSDTNGKGIYMHSGTENDRYPIVYYRGEVEDNNVFFANHCWKIIRTTDTGGIKMIYNGVKTPNKKSLNESDYTMISNTAGFTFDSDKKLWTKTITGTFGSSSAPLEMSFKVPTHDNYVLEVSGMTGSGSNGNAYVSIYKNGTNVNSTNNADEAVLSLFHTYGTLSNDDVIKVTCYGNGTTSSPTTINIRVYYSSTDLGYGCDNMVDNAQITLNGTRSFPYSNGHNSLAYDGYMNGKVYENKIENPVSSAYFGNNFTYDNGSYTLVNAKVGYDGTHHYTCNLTSSSGTCTSIRYYNSYDKYILLTNGESVEDALLHMHEQVSDSNAKSIIDTWYANNILGYTDKIEDTVYCNDRSINRIGSWDPNSNMENYALRYNVIDRTDITNIPNLNCINKKDALTVSNTKGNKKLTYPVALLTSDEVTLAGGKGGRCSNFYLRSGSYYWLMSPTFYDDLYAYNLRVSYAGYMGYNSVNGVFGLRPVIALKHGINILDGDGTVTNPFVIE